MDVEDALAQEDCTSTAMLGYSPGYRAYVSEDEETNGFFLTFCHGDMPPHSTERFATVAAMRAWLAERGWLTGWEVEERA